MATYNGEKYISEQLESILKQLNSDDEIIISDNESSDMTLEIIRSFNDDRIKVLSLKKNKSFFSFHNKIHYIISKNFENSISHTTGDYIFLADQDDIWVDNKIEVILSHLKPGILVMHDCVVIDETNEIIADSFFEMVGSRKGFIRNILFPSYHGCCIAFSSGLLKKILPFPRHLIMHDAWIGLLSDFHNKVQFINDKLIIYRKNSNSASGDSVSSVNSIFFGFYYRIELLILLIIRIFRIFLTKKNG
jgi:glycosyltransferase involved in cell wall biosynthesis